VILPETFRGIFPEWGIEEWVGCGRNEVDEFFPSFAY
jgi:hypothetical protein